MDLENEKIGLAYIAPDSYFKESESRLLRRLGIDGDSPEATVSSIEAIKPEAVLMKLDTSGIQKRARKQDPMTSKSVGVSKDLDAVGKVEIAPLTFTTNENPEWVNFSAIAEETSGLGESLNITKVTYGDLLNPVDETIAPESEELETPISKLTKEEAVTPIIEKNLEFAESIVIHEVPESVGLDELESYIAPINAPKAEITEEVLEQEEYQVMNLEAPPTAFAPIAGRQKESATPGWLGIAASLAAIVAAYFIWNAIQPPKTEEVMATELQQDEPTLIESPLDEPILFKDTIPDGLQLVEPLIGGEMPSYKEPNVYTIIDAKEMPPRTKQALKDLEDIGLTTFDMEDEMFEELDFESL